MVLDCRRFWCSYRDLTETPAAGPGVAGYLGFARDRVPLSLASYFGFGAGAGDRPDPEWLRRVAGVPIGTSRLDRARPCLGALDPPINAPERARLVAELGDHHRFANLALGGPGEAEPPQEVWDWLHSELGELEDNVPLELRVNTFALTASRRAALDARLDELDMRHGIERRIELEPAAEPTQWWLRPADESPGWRVDPLLGLVPEGGASRLSLPGWLWRGYVAGQGLARTANLSLARLVRGRSAAPVLVAAADGLMDSWSLSTTESRIAAAATELGIRAQLITLGSTRDSSPDYQVGRLLGGTSGPIQLMLGVLDAAGMVTRLEPLLIADAAIATALGHDPADIDPPAHADRERGRTSLALASRRGTAGERGA